MRISYWSSDVCSSDLYRGAQGLRPEFIAELERQFGLDKPAHERFFLMIRNYLAFDFGESFFRGRPVVDLVIEKMDVSISIGLWTTLITYLVCIPLGIEIGRAHVELQSLMRISYAVFCLKKKTQ